MCWPRSRSLRKRRDVSRVEFSHQGLRVLGCTQLGVGIVEEAVDITVNSTVRGALRNLYRIRGLAPGTPVPNPPRPTFEGGIAVAASIKFLVTMQSQVYEVRGQVVYQRPQSRGLGNDEGHVMCLQEIHEGGGEETLVTDFDRMPHDPIFIDAQAGTSLHPRRAPPGQGAGRTGVPWQQLEERLQPAAVILEGRRQLPEYRAELLAQIENSGGEEIRERLAHFAQLAHVCDEPSAFDCKNKVRRGVGVPL